jgi:cytochrome P450
MLTPEFTVHRLRRLEPRIDAIIADRLDAMEGAGSPVDFVREFAMPIPSLVVCELLGVPYAEQADFLERTNNRFEFSGGPETSLAAVGESLGYLTDLVARQRVDPGDGLLGMLIREQGDDIDDRELAGMADGLLTGGHDTTASMLALGAIVLLNDPETRDALVHDDTKAGSVVEELLRLLSVVQVPFPRFAREEVELGGERIGKGDLVLCSLTSANRDPVLGEDMDRFDPGRGVVPHFAFGHGVHHCVGAQLARMEMRVAYPALFRRFPTLRLDVPMPEVQFRALSIVYGVQTLPVAW